MKKIMLFALGFMFLAGASLASDLKIGWDKSPDATGYKVYESQDMGATWQEKLDTNSTNATLSMTEHGLVLIRISAYNRNGETIRTGSGIWFNGDWLPPKRPKDVGVE